MVRLGPALKGNGRSTPLLLSEPSNHGGDVIELPDLESVIVAAPQKADAGKGGRISTLARSPLFKRAMTDQGDNFPGVTPICWACGGNMKATDRFCSACGAPKTIYSQGTSQTSSLEILPDTPFCPNCGGKISNALQVLTSTDRSQEPNTTCATQPKELSPISEEPTILPS